MKIKYRKELALATLEIVICTIGAILELGTNDSLYQVFVIPVITALVLYGGTMIIQGQQQVVYTTYFFTLVAGCIALATTLSSCALTQGVEDSSTAIPLIIAFSGGSAFVAGLIHLNIKNSKRW